MYIYVVISIFCIAILISMFIHSFQYKNRTREQWLYRQLLLAAVVFTVADVAYLLVFCYSSEISKYVILLVHGIKRTVFVLVSYGWYRYTEFILVGKYVKSKTSRILMIIMLVNIVVACIIGGVSKKAFNPDGNEQVISNYFSTITGMFALFMIVLGLLKTIWAWIKDRTDGDKNKYQRGVVFNSYPLLFALGQFLIDNLPLISMGITLASINSYTIKRLIENKRAIDVSSVERFHSLFISSCYVNIEDNTYVFIGDEQNNPILKVTPKYNDMLSLYATQAIHPEDREKFVEMCQIENVLNKLNDTDHFFFFDYRRKIKDEFKWHRLHVVIAATDENDLPTNILLSNMYIDDVKQMEFSYNQQLEMANKAKSDFLSNVSHELRTPMNAIMGMIKLLENDAEDPGKVKDDVRKLQASGRHLLSVINDVLDMNKIESGVFVINKAKFDLSVLLEDINTVMLQLTKERKQNFLMELKNVKNNALVGDKARLSQILINILTNSTKYTLESGDIRLIVTQLESKDCCRLQFKIIDNGIGMEPEFVSRIFEPFAREEQRIPEETSGTGLGMPIVKNIVDLLNGSIVVESTPGKGSVFIVEIDFEIAKEEYESTILGKETAIPKKTLSGLNLLIAEDNEVNGEIIMRLLELEEAVSTVCKNGKEAVEMYMAKPCGTFDAILMDIRMPVMNGYEAAKTIRASGKEDAMSIPILSLTANVFSEDVELAKEAGMNGHIPKPIDMQVLKATIEKVCIH